MSLDLTTPKALLFDIYATLINWEDGIHPFLDALAAPLPTSSPLRARASLLKAYAHHEKAVEHTHPSLPYPQILEEVYRRIAADLGVTPDPAATVEFGKSIGSWPAFPDTVAAMQTLGKHYKLFVLSNVDDASWARTAAGPLAGVRWDGVFTAEMIGSYKPARANYEYAMKRLKEEWGVERGEIAMTAQSLDIDAVMAKEVGMKSVWIARFGGKAAMGGDREALEREGKIDVGAAFGTLGEMAEAVEEAFER